MKEILLTQGKVAIVDDCDYEYLRQWKWHYSRGYATRRVGTKSISMFRVILSRMGIVPKKYLKLKDKLDYRRGVLVPISACLGVKRIPLTKGKFAIVDSIDYEYLMQWNWHAAAGGKYAARKSSKVFYLHREVIKRMGLVGKAVDHINGDTLDNRRCNLRVCTNQQNLMNRGPQVNNTSGYKGVIWSKERSNWVARIKFNQKQIHLGTYKTKIEAAQAYNTAAIKHFGSYAYLNPL